MDAPLASRSIGTALGIGAVALLLAALSLAKVFGQVDPGYAVRWWTVDGGGTTSGAGAQLRLGGTVGQPDAGRLTGSGAPSLTLQGGFWNTTVITRPLAAPIELHCAPECDPQSPLGAWMIDLTWLDANADASDFHVFRSDDGAAEVEIVTVPADSMHYTDHRIDAGHRYTYRVRAHRHRDDRYSPPSVSSECRTVEPTATPGSGPAITPLPDLTATRLPDGTPNIVEQMAPGPCEPELCPGVESNVPPDVLTSALADPNTVGGYCDLLNPSQPYHPTFNPRRARLTLQNVGAPFHPPFNSLVFKVGCN